MRAFRFAQIAALPVLAVVLGIAMALKLARPLQHIAGWSSSSGADAERSSPLLAASSAIRPAQQSLPSTTPLSPDTAQFGAWQSNVLELPEASRDFVGDWGGNIHSSIQRVSPDLVGTSPDRISIIFGQRGDTVFMASELYGSANQRLVRNPTVKIIDPRVALIQYESADDQLDYVCAHRFKLGGDDRMSYRSTVLVYDLHSHKLMGIVKQRASLRRLLTLRDQLKFERPSRHQIPRAEISASETFAHH